MTTMPTTASTTRLDLACFFWASGLAFHRCVKGEPWASFEFLDPDARAPGLAKDYQRVRRRLLYCLRVADLRGGVASLDDLDHPPAGQRQALRATDRRVTHAEPRTAAR